MAFGAPGRYFRARSFHGFIEKDGEMMRFTCLSAMILLGAVERAHAGPLTYADVSVAYSGNLASPHTLTQRETEFTDQSLGTGIDIIQFDSVGAAEASARAVVISEGESELIPIIGGSTRAFVPKRRKLFLAAVRLYRRRYCVLR
jgi:hypothetical protein